MKRILSLLVLFFLLASLMLSACEMTDFVEIKKQLAAAKELKNVVSQQQKEISILKEELERLNDLCGSVNKNISDLLIRTDRNEIDIAFLKENKVPAYNRAIFDPSQSSFQRIDAVIGTFAISIQDVKSHADGVKVRLHVGNLTSATFNGGVFKARYGPRIPSLYSKDPKWSRFIEQYDKIKDRFREKEVPFTVDLQPGVWNELNISLPGISPQDFGYLELSLETNTISLVKKQPK